MSLPADDLLSAFHDGEANSAERAAIEQRLAESAEARRELSEIRQVSSLLKGLPREPLPSEFPQQVLQAIEREMLIPSRPSDSVAAPPSDSLGNATWSRRWFGAAAVLTSAAGLLLLVRVVDDPARRGPTASPQLVETNKLRMAPTSAALDTSSSGLGDVPPPMAADATSPMARRSGMAGGAAASSPVAKNLLARTESEGLIVDRAGLREAAIGDVVRAMQTDGSEVAVVWLTVVDRQDGLSGLQFLLSDNHISREDVAEKADRWKQPESSSGQMHAVFVESNPEQLIAALTDLSNKDFWQSMEVDQPIELAQLEDVRRGRSSVASKLNEGSVESRTLTAADEAKNRSGSLAPKSRAATPALKSADKKIANTAPAPMPSAAGPAPAGAKGVQDAKVSLAKQVTFDVRFEALVQNQSLNQLNQQTRNRGTARNSFQKPTAVEKLAGAASADQRPMQVLFVVVDQSQAAKSQLSPNNSSKPAAAPAKTRTEPAKPADQDGAA